jgi:hypothetical protein
MPFTLSGIQNYSPTYLTETADHLGSQADRVEGVFARAHNQVASITWEGAAGDAAREHYAGDAMTVFSHADVLRETAQTANRSAETLGNAKTEVMAEVEQAQQDGFTVDEDFAVRDTTSKTPQELILRAPYLQAHEAALASKVAAFQAQETSAAAALTGHAAALGAFQFPNPGSSYPAPTPPCPNGEVWSPGNHQCVPGNPFIGLNPPGMPPTPPGAGVQQGIIDGSRQGLPVLAPSFYTPTGGNSSHIQMVDNTRKQDPAPPNPWTDPGGVWAAPTGEYPDPPPVTALPTTPQLPTPPAMTAMGPDDPWPPNPEPYVPMVPTPGNIIASGGLGYVAGGPYGGLMGVAGSVMGPLFTNNMHGMSINDSVQLWEGSWGDMLLGDDFNAR